LREMEESKVEPSSHDDDPLNEDAELKYLQVDEGRPNVESIGKGEAEKLMHFTDPSDETFMKQNRYSWDLAIVFEGSTDEKVAHMGARVKDIQAAGLQTRVFRGGAHHQDKIFCKVRAPLSRLQHYADYINRKVLLNQSEAKRIMEAGDPKFGIEPVTLPHDPTFSKITPYEFIHAKYDTQVPQTLYAPDKNDPLEPYIDHPFRSTLRLQLILSILAARKKEGGAEFDPKILLAHKEIAAIYPLRNLHAIEVLKREWLPWMKAPNQQPLDLIRMYFGEQIALYFAFLGHYTHWLIFISIPGTICGVLTYTVWREYDSPLSGAFSLIVAVWGILMLELWKRKQAHLALEWGMTNIEQEQVDRPEFKGEMKISPINGQLDCFFSSQKYRKLLKQSAGIILTVLLLVIMIVGVVFWFRFWSIFVSDTAWLNTYGDYIASAMNAVQIQVLDRSYSKLAIYLNDRENHRTDIQYQDSITAKLFVFKFVNSYASFIYLAFIKTSLEEPYLATGKSACDPNCIYLLFLNLVIIFGSQLVVGNLTEVALPYLNAKRKEKKEAALGSVASSPAEKEFDLEGYDPVMGLLMDYSEVAVQFGYMSLFVAALPLAPLLGLVNNWVEIRSDAFKLLTQTRRPLASPAEDIGTWQAIFNIMGILSVISNAALICFVKENVFDPDATMADRLWIFVILQYGMLFLMFCIALAVPDLPEKVAKQLKRQAFIQATVVEKIAMEEEDCFRLLPGVPGEVEVLSADVPEVVAGLLTAAGLDEYRDVETSIARHVESSALYSESKGGLGDWEERKELPSVGAEEGVRKALAVDEEEGDTAGRSRPSSSKGAPVEEERDSSVNTPRSPMRLSLDFLEDEQNSQIRRLTSIPLGKEQSFMAKLMATNVSTKVAET